jgi:hypothetical protein
MPTLAEFVNSKIGQMSSWFRDPHEKLDIVDENDSPTTEAAKAAKLCQEANESIASCIQVLTPLLAVANSNSVGNDEEDAPTDSEENEPDPG